MNDEPVTKVDLERAVRDLKEYILEREVSATRWFVTIQVAYFFGTLAAVWFMLSNLLHR